MAEEKVVGSSPPTTLHPTTQRVERTPRELGYRMPAEWEPHGATWLAWPHSDDWPGKLEAVQWVFCEIIRELQRGESVRLLIKNDRERMGIQRQLERAGVSLNKVQLVVAPTDRSWTRDNLPCFVTAKSTESATTLGAVKFRFNAWARYPEYQLDDAAGRLVADQFSQRSFYPVVEIDGELCRMVLEGGSIDVDGEGTLLTTRRCLLGSPYERNPGISQEQIERVLADYLGAFRTIWLPDGIAGDDTSGHVDDFARFVAPATVALGCSDDPADRHNLEQAAEILESSVDAQGRRLRVVRLPCPEPLFFDGERLPASYANFYIANACVLVPTFNDPRDREALSTLSDLFPSRRVVGIHCSDLVVGLGAIHCSTQQEPLSGGR